MLAKVLSGAILGIDAYVVEVEVDIAQGLPVFATVGLPDGAVKESKERVKSAIKNSGYDFPPKAHYREPRPGRRQERRGRVRPAHRDRHPLRPGGRLPDPVWTITFSSERSPSTAG